MGQETAVQGSDERGGVIDTTPDGAPDDGTIEFAGDTVGSLMHPPAGIFAPEQTVAEAVEQLREETRSAFITYGYVVDPAGRLLGVVVMREMLLAGREAKLGDIMIREPFAFWPETPLADALPEAARLHFPSYPVVDTAGTLVGLVRGEDLFRNQLVAIAQQAGSMVGVEKEERTDTPLVRSLIMRHPWLQFNLLTAFVAAAVVGMFEDTLAQLVILAVFLPVMAGQTGNTGGQALAVTLRGMTLGDLKPGSEGQVVVKEGLLGLANGVLVGLTAGLGMYVYAAMQDDPNALMLGLVVFVSMVAACAIAGVSGAIIPQVLKRLGADPATASSIFLTTMSDVVSMGVFLGLATVLIT